MGVNSAIAAALDRSGQPILPFLQDGNYFEVSAFALDPHVSGKVKPGNPSLSILNGANVHDMGESYSFVNAALKVQATEHLSIGLLYDQPFGAKANYSSDESVIPKAVPIVRNQGMFHNGNTGESTNAKLNLKIFHWLSVSNQSRIGIFMLDQRIKVLKVMYNSVG